MMLRNSADDLRRHHVCTASFAVSSSFAVPSFATPQSFADVPRVGDDGSDGGNSDGENQKLERRELQRPLSFADRGRGGDADAEFHTTRGRE